MEVHHDGSQDLTFADASFYYGITCFMVTTTRGIVSVWGLPKDKLISPFWGVAMFFLGAWTIGAITLWGPCLVSGFSDWPATPAEVFEYPTFRAKWVHYFQV